ncbi:MAG: pyruvate dehydrogenase (acetyl-transferring), homodimeric type [Candidatus Latescibacterota bacterium]|nr:pyruvate dehydrogenase (acetyl-transferring), homodimeric type [Candidatus Latescibacterota bacterium]
MSEPSIPDFADPELDAIETREWLDSLDYVVASAGRARAAQLIERLLSHARERGVEIPRSSTTPYVNSIPANRQPPYPGDHHIEQRLRNILCWNAMVMVVRANQEDSTIGGHIATYASAATMMEVALNHFLRGRTGEFEGDQVLFQAHVSPGLYARAYLEGRLSEQQLLNFRHELRPNGGLPSYPHPRLMPEFWQFPSASMGLSPIVAIYQARFNRYLEDRGLKPPSDAKVWAFIGDGETDEPESLGAISLAARERLDNLIFVVNCNLQRLDGPVRGNGKIIQELEAVFRGAGWNVVKVIWGRDWDPLLARDDEGLLARRMSELVDGQYQKYSVSDGDYQRHHFFGTDERLMAMSRQLTDEQIRTIRRGGHDSEKVYAGLQAAVSFEGAPSVVLIKTIKGFGMGRAGEGTMTTHQIKKLDFDMLKEIRTRFEIPLTDKAVEEPSFYRPPDDSRELTYLRERRHALGGSVPRRTVVTPTVTGPESALFDEFESGSSGREISSTGAFVRILAKLLRDDAVGKYVVPIVSDEARTFGMEAMFRQYGIYSRIGQLYEPVDSESLTYYREARDGQLLEEGISEAGALSSFTAAGTAYATHSLPCLPFFIFYSMFGFQRVGDLIYAAGDQRARGFLIGAISGRTTINGEGLQHQDGHSHAAALGYPHVVCYDPTYGYEIAAIVKEGIRRMLGEGEDVIYYLTVHNEPYEMLDAPGPAGTEEILKGMYRLRATDDAQAHLFAGGAILPEALKAAHILEQDFEIGVDVWSVTSFKQLHDEGANTERWNLMHPEQEPRPSYMQQCLQGTEGSFVIASDWLKVMANSVARWFPRPPVCLGTDGFGRSESRDVLRHYFEVDAATIAYSAIVDLMRQGRIATEVAAEAQSWLDIDPQKSNPRDL